LESNEDTETLKLVEEGFAWARSRIVGIGDTPLNAPTPCENWDLRQLINHAVNAVATIAGVLTGPDTVDAWGPGAVSADEMANIDSGWPNPVLRYDELTSTIVETAKTDPPERTFLMHGAHQRTIVLARAVVFDSVVHGWDIAKATGQEATIPSALAEPLLAFAASIPDGSRAPSFAPTIDMSASASPTARLVGFLGRQP
jgi:uncharacterized protein (TIGR03086 family)